MSKVTIPVAVTEKHFNEGSKPPSPAPAKLHLKGEKGQMAMSKLTMPATITQKAFDGRWIRDKNGLDLIDIHDGKLRWSRGKKSKTMPVQLNKKNHVVIAGREGEHEMVLKGGKLLWSDGDSWSRIDDSNIFKGKWVREKNNKHSFLINGNKMRWSGQAMDTPSIPLMLDSTASRVTFRMNGATHEGHMDGQKLKWSNGDTWTRL